MALWPSGLSCNDYTKHPQLQFFWYKHCEAHLYSSAVFFKERKPWRALSSLLVLLLVGFMLLVLLASNRIMLIDSQLTIIMLY